MTRCTALIASYAQLVRLCAFAALECAKEYSVCTLNCSTVKLRPQARLRMEPCSVFWQRWLLKLLLAKWTALRAHASLDNCCNSWVDYI